MNDTKTSKRQGQMFRTLSVKNPFIVARFIFFAVLAYLTILQLIFAAWNISTTTSAGQNVSNTPVFLVFNTCIILLFLLHGVIDMVMPKEQLSSVRLECIWSAATNLLQTGIAIGVTISAPQELCDISNWSYCASSSLLAPIAWLTSVILLSYFFALTIAAVAHANVHPNIWTSTVHDIAWFGYPPVNQTDTGDFVDYYDWKSERDPTLEDKAAEDSEKAPWAAFARVRRGIDHPFSIDKKPGGKVRDEVSMPSIPLPPYTPPKTRERIAGNGSRFIEVISEPGRKARQANVPARFPSTVTDHDKPIPLPRRSEWVRADDIATDKSRKE